MDQATPLLSLQTALEYNIVQQHGKDACQDVGLPYSNNLQDTTLSQKAPNFEVAATALIPLNLF
ncbi:hypothetical protein D3C77_638990 [compost metagenome]